jgi:hypothetical protein
LEVINSDSDKKKIKHPALKIFNISTKKLLLHSFGAFKKFFVNNDFSSSTFTSGNTFFQNSGYKNKLVTTFSSNLTTPMAERHTRKFANIKPTSNNFNLSFDLNAVNSHFQYIQKNLIVDNLRMHNLLGVN